MNQYPLWKYLLIASIVLIGTIYAMPNLFIADPALQIGGSTRNVAVNATTLDAISKKLQQDHITLKNIELNETTQKIIVRLANSEDQKLAWESLKYAFSDHIIALTNADNTPAWLHALGAAPMYLGLDLRGGVHLVLDVDMEDALAKNIDSREDALKDVLREAKIRYINFKQDHNLVLIRFRSPQDLEQATALLRQTDKSQGMNFKVHEKEPDLLVASLGEQEIKDIKTFALEQNITTLRNRVNELGVAEPIIQRQGDRRIVVQLPGISDSTQAIKILSATATLEYHAVDTEHDMQDALDGRVPAASKVYYERDGRPVLLLKKIITSGDHIRDASSGFDENARPAVTVRLDTEGGDAMSHFTRDNIGKPMAVVFIENKVATKKVDGKIVQTKKKTEEVISVATIQGHFSNRFQTTGLDSNDEARDLALLLRAGALKAPVNIVEERTIGPSLGAENIQRGFHSTWLGFALIAVFMIAYYAVFGVTAVVALGVNVILLVALLSALQATLTLPGMAAIALTVGMAIDANVLINERIREELRNGNSPHSSIQAGYERAFGTIIDSNITTLIAGFALFLMGSGPVRGFAVVLCLGILTSMFSGVMVSRALVNLVYGRRPKIERLAIGNTHWK